jgi:hypothetical protein
MDELDQPSMPPEHTIRSELVFGAMAYASNRFLLTKLLVKATANYTDQICA